MSHSHIIVMFQAAPPYEGGDTFVGAFSSYAQVAALPHFDKTPPNGASELDYYLRRCAIGAVDDGTDQSYLYALSGHPITWKWHRNGSKVVIVEGVPTLQELQP